MMSRRERRELALTALFSEIDPEQPNHCWDCKKASVLIRKNLELVAERGKDGEEIKDKMGRVQKWERMTLERDIHCEHYNALMTGFIYHCEQFEPLEDE